MLSVVTTIDQFAKNDVVEKTVFYLVSLQPLIVKPFIEFLNLTSLLSDTIKLKGCLVVGFVIIVIASCL